MVTCILIAHGYTADEAMEVVANDALSRIRMRRTSSRVFASSSSDWQRRHAVLDRDGTAGYESFAYVRRGRKA